MHFYERFRTRHGLPTAADLIVANWSNDLASLGWGPVRREPSELEWRQTGLSNRRVLVRLKQSSDDTTEMAVSADAARLVIEWLRAAAGDLDQRPPAPRKDIWRREVDGRLHPLSIALVLAGGVTLFLALLLPNVETPPDFGFVTDNTVLKHGEWQIPRRWHRRADVPVLSMAGDLAARLADLLGWNRDGGMDDLRLG